MSLLLCTGNVTRLVTVQKTSLGLLDVRSRQFEVVQFAVFKPVAVAFDLARALYYWADVRGSIHKSDGKQTVAIFTGLFRYKSAAALYLQFVSKSLFLCRTTRHQKFSL